MYNSNAKETEGDIMKSESHLGGELTAEVPNKDRKKRIEGSKEQRFKNMIEGLKVCGLLTS
jgi:hypothetical protein